LIEGFPDHSQQLYTSSVCILIRQFLLEWINYMIICLVIFGKQFSKSCFELINQRFGCFVCGFYNIAMVECLFVGCIFILCEDKSWRSPEIVVYRALW